MIVQETQLCAEYVMYALKFSMESSKSGNLEDV